MQGSFAACRPICQWGGQCTCQSISPADSASVLGAPVAVLPSGPVRHALQDRVMSVDATHKQLHHGKCRKTYSVDKLGLLLRSKTRAVHCFRLGVFLVGRFLQLRTRLAYVAQHLPCRNVPATSTCPGGCLPATSTNRGEMHTPLDRFHPDCQSVRAVTALLAS